MCPPLGSYPRHLKKKFPQRKGDNHGNLLSGHLVYMYVKHILFNSWYYKILGRSIIFENNIRSDTLKYGTSGHAHLTYPSPSHISLHSFTVIELYANIVIPR